MKSLNKGEILVAMVFCGLTGGASGYLGASYSPVPAQIAIVDVQSLVKKAMERNQTQTEEDAKALTAKIKSTTDKLVLQGIIVLDSQTVINAPEEAYVSIE